jgi:hypothetical protein
MKDAHVEYLGFATQGTTREYMLRVRQPGGEQNDFTLAIPLDAFTSRRARFQDAPEICFLKLQRELAACPDRLPASSMEVSDAELEDYRSAHAPKPPNRRPNPPSTPTPPPKT